MLAVRAKRTATAALTAGRFDEGGVYGRAMRKRQQRVALQTLDPHQRLEVLLGLELDDLHVLPGRLAQRLVGNELERPPGRHGEDLLAAGALEVVELVEGEGDRRGADGDAVVLQ